MKTFFLTAPTGVDVKNFLLGRFYHAARERQDIRLVVFVPPERLDACREAFAHATCVIEPIPYHPEGRMKKLFRVLCMSSIPSESIWLRQKYTQLDGGSYLSFLIKRLCWGFGHFGWWHALIRWLDETFFRDGYLWDEFFERYQPSAVFATNLMIECDFTILKAAKKRRVPMLAMTRSWDNPSSKVMLRVFPDRLLVQNQILVDEVSSWDRYPRERIEIVGFPQFDEYLDDTVHQTKEEFAKIHGLDASKRWIAYFTGPFLTGVLKQKDRGDHVEMIQHAIDRGEIPNAMIIARIHPNDDVEFKPALGHIPTLTFGKDFQFNAADVRTLLNFIRLSDVAIHPGSTIGLEAAVFDKPTVLLGFNGYHDEDVPYQHRLGPCLDHTTHYIHAQNCHGMWRVSNEKELVDAITTYLKDPSLHQAGRTCLRDKIIGPLSGHVGDRILEILIGVSERRV